MLPTVARRSLVRAVGLRWCWGWRSWDMEWLCLAKGMGTWGEWGLMRSATVTPPCKWQTVKVCWLFSCRGESRGASWHAEKIYQVCTQITKSSTPELSAVLSVKRDLKKRGGRAQLQH